MKHLTSSYMAFVMFGLIAIFFKLEGVADFPWWIILAPIWCPIVAVLALLIIYIIITLLKDS